MATTRIRRRVRERVGSRRREGGALRAAGLHADDVESESVTQLTASTRARRRPADLEARYERLFEKLQAPAKGMVRRAFGTAFSDDELDDLYSGAWVSTLAALERKPRKLDDEDLRRYLMTAVANQASRELRRRGRKPTLPIDVVLGAADPTPAPDETAAQVEDARVTREVLGSLPPRRRAVMVFRYGWGLEPDEVCGVIGDLSPRAYRKEVERGVAEVVRKMRMVEEGEWCDSREPLLRAVAAGLADQDEERQARQHLAHCRSCTSFLRRLSGHLHELGTPLALTSAADLAQIGGSSALSRFGEAVDRVRDGVGDLLGRGAEGTEQAAAQAIAAGGSSGAGVAGTGIVAKLAGLSAVPKLVTACIGTGAAATACVAAGVVPGFDAPRDARDRPADEFRQPVREASAHVRSRTPADVDSDQPAVARSSTSTGDTGDPSAPPVPSESSTDPGVDDASPPAPPPQPSPSPVAQEFEPVGTPVEPAASPDRSSAPTGSGGSGSGGGDFGP